MLNKINEVVKEFIQEEVCKNFCEWAFGDVSQLQTPEDFFHAWNTLHPSQPIQRKRKAIYDLRKMVRLWVLTKPCEIFWDCK